MKTALVIFLNTFLLLFFFSTFVLAQSINPPETQPKPTTNTSNTATENTQISSQPLNDPQKSQTNKDFSVQKEIPTTNTSTIVKPYFKQKGPEKIIEDPTSAKISDADTITEGFIKGELGQIGASRILPEGQFIALRLGYLNVDSIHYLSVSPVFDLKYMEEKLRVGAGIPINFEAYNSNRDGFKAFDGTVRKKDWDRPGEYLKVLRYLTYGRKEDNLHVNVSQLHAGTIGHGPIMRRYISNLDINDTKLGGQFDAYNNYGGFEFHVNDLTKFNILTLLTFVKPLSFYFDDYRSRSLSFGVTYATDRQAPTHIGQSRDIEGVLDLDGVDTEAINFTGVDAEFKFFKNRNIDLKSYLDYSKMMSFGSGRTLGLLGRFNFFLKKIHALRTRLELRHLDANYIPSYFDIFYEIQKYQYVQGQSSTDLASKLDYLRTLSGGSRFGYYLECMYSIIGVGSLGAALEGGSTTAGDKNLLLHAQVPLLIVDLYITYHKRNFEAFNSLFKFEDNELLFVQSRIQILPFMYINAGLKRTFEFEEFVLNKSYSIAHRSGMGGFTNVWDLQADLELGWEF